MYLLVTSQSGRDTVTQRYSFYTGRRLDDNNVHDVRIVRDGRQVRQTTGCKKYQKCSRLTVISTTLH